MEQLTFEEKDVESFRDFINFVASEAEFKMDTKKAFRYSKLYKECVDILKKMESHIFELKQVIEPKKDKK